MQVSLWNADLVSFGRYEKKCSASVAISNMQFHTLVEMAVIRSPLAHLVRAGGGDSEMRPQEPLCHLFLSPSSSSLFLQLCLWVLRSSAPSTGFPDNVHL